MQILLFSLVIVILIIFNIYTPSLPDGQSEVYRGVHGEAGNGDHTHKHVGEEPEMFVVKKAECSKIDTAKIKQI